MSTIAIIGPATFHDYQCVCDILKRVDIGRIVSCALTTLDVLSEEYAAEHGIPVVRCTLEIVDFDMSAHLLRNRAVIDASEVVVVLLSGEDAVVNESADYARKQKKKVHTFSCRPGRLSDS